jgi:hypothetical protein
MAHGSLDRREQEQQQSPKNCTHQPCNGTRVRPRLTRAAHSRADNEQEVEQSNSDGGEDNETALHEQVGESDLAKKNERNNRDR